MSDIGHSRPALALPAGARSRQGRRAGVVSRLVAAVVDLAVVVLLLVGTYAGWVAVAFVLQPDGFSAPAPSLALVGSAYVVLASCYLAAGWVLIGRSAGDQVMGLRVTRRHGEPLRPARALARAALCVVFPVGLLWTALSAAELSVQDLLLGTHVVHDWTAGR